MRRQSDPIAIAVALLIGLATNAFAAPTDEPRICADPNNLPFSNSAEAGFENSLATMVAQHLGEQVSYTWWAQRRGFIRNTLKAGQCDVVMGVPSGYESDEHDQALLRLNLRLRHPQGAAS